MTLEDIFRNVVSNSPIDAFDNFSELQILVAINEGYISVRDEFIKNNRIEGFLSSEMVRNLQTSKYYPYFNKATLSSVVLKAFPLYKTIANCAVLYTKNKIVSGSTASYSKGDVAYINNVLYECVTSFNTVDTFALTFDPSKIRSFYEGNGLKYFVNDVIYDKTNDVYYKCILDNTQTSTAGTLTSQIGTNFEQVYWKKTKKTHRTAQPINIQKERKIKALIDSGEFVISCVENTLYASQNIKSLYIQYIPEHEYLLKFSDEFNLPDNAVKPLVEQTINLLVKGRIPDVKGK